MTALEWEPFKNGKQVAKKKKKSKERIAAELGISTLVGYVLIDFAVSIFK